LEATGLPRADRGFDRCLVSREWSLSHQADGPGWIGIAAEQSVRPAQDFDVIELTQVRRAGHTDGLRAPRQGRPAVHENRIDLKTARIEILFLRTCSSDDDARRATHGVPKIRGILLADLFGRDDGDRLWNLIQWRGHARGHELL